MNADGQHCFRRNLGDLAKSFSLRCTSKFLRPEFDTFNQELKHLKTVSLGSVCLRTIRRGVQPAYCEDGDVTVLKTAQLKHGHIDTSGALMVTTEFRDSHPSAIVRSGDVLISSTGEGRGKIDVYLGSEPAVADSHVTIITLGNGFSPIFVAELLRQPFGEMQLAQLEVAVKGTPEIYREEIAKIQLVPLALDKQESIATRILEIEDYITSAREGLRAADEIIDEILCAEFDYPLREHREREKIQQFTTNLHTMASGFTLRSSSKFHHPGFELTECFFARKAHERINAFVAVPIRLGATATKSDLIEDGSAYYVHPGATKRQEVIDVADCHQITDEFYASARQRFGLRRGDVILNRAAEGTIGKSGLWDSDEFAVASDFTMRIRFNDRINPRFAWYYFRSVMFQTQVVREKRGMGNMTNIFPSEVEHMLIVACEKSKQDALVRDIEHELEYRKSLLRSIESNRAEIATLVKQALR